VRDENGTGNNTARTTQQWPNAKIFWRRVERTASMWLPMPKTCGPFLVASVSSSTMRTGACSRSRPRIQPKSRRPTSSGSQVPREKNR
jgi:hypothetical protein